MHKPSQNLDPSSKMDLEFLDGLLDEPGAPVAQWVKRWPTDLADRV